MKNQSISFTIFVYLHNTSNGVIVRVRWNHKRSVVMFTTGCLADPNKWVNQSAIPNTTHKVHGYSFTSHEINTVIMDYRNAITEVFKECELLGHIPSKEELKESVNEKIQALYAEPEEQVDVDYTQTEIGALYEDFLDAKENDKLWDPKTRYKYGQTIQHFLKACPGIPVEKIDKKVMTQYRNWFLQNDYKNATIAKHFRNFRCFLRWLDNEGHTIPKSALNYKENIQIRQKRVLFLKYDELMAFYHYKFNKVGQNYLDRARDLFCFMAFTSLRYSDLANLKKANVTENTLQIFTEKTDAMLTIPLISYAQDIIKKYANDTDDVYLFRVPSNQKLNEYIKEAAQIVGLDRTVVDVQFSGNKRSENVYKISEVLTCHVARKTFVTTSLQLGIPQSVVMICTGHSDFRAMRPYVAVADETTQSEMQKWDRQSDRALVSSLIEHADDEQLKKLVSMIKTKVNIFN